MNLVTPQRAERLAKARRSTRDQSLASFDATFFRDPRTWGLHEAAVFVQLLKGTILQLSGRGETVEISTAELRRACGRPGHDLWSKLIYPAKQGHTTFNNAGRIVQGHCSKYDAFGHLARVLHRYRTLDRASYEHLFDMIRWAVGYLQTAFTSSLEWVERHLRARFNHVRQAPEPTYMTSSSIKGGESGAVSRRGAPLSQPALLWGADAPSGPCGPLRGIQLRPS